MGKAPTIDLISTIMGQIARVPSSEEPTSIAPSIHLTIANVTIYLTPPAKPPRTPRRKPGAQP